MPLSELEMMPIRTNVAALISAYVPSETGDKRFDHITKDYKGSGTTCGFLCHWLLWRLGCNGPEITYTIEGVKKTRKIVNRKEEGFVYDDGENIMRIWNLGKKPFLQVTGTNRALEMETKKLGPNYGDIVFIKQGLNGPTTTEHVFVFLDEFMKEGKRFWRTAEAGQTNLMEKQCACFKERALTFDKLNKKVILSGDPPMREVIGWLQLAELSYNMIPPFPPVPPLPIPPLDSIPLSVGSVTQDNWRWCKKCEGLFFAGRNPLKEECPAGGTHSKTSSGNYSLVMNTSSAPRQPYWRGCKKCRGLFFAGNATTGKCPKGGGHEQACCGNYFLAMDTSAHPGQKDWRWCKKCQGLFFAGHPTQGVCTAGGAHDKSESGTYSLVQK